MAKEKKPLTTKQKIRKYRAIQWGTTATQYVTIATPYVVLGAINWDKWFMSNPEGWKVGIGGAIAFALFSTVAALITKVKKDDLKLNPYIPFIIGCLMTVAILKLVASIILEISDILLITTSGLVGALFQDIESNDAKAKKERFIKARESAQAKVDEEQARIDIEQEQAEKEKGKRRYF